MRDLQAQTLQQAPASPTSHFTVALKLPPPAVVLLTEDDGAAISRDGVVAVSARVATQPGHGSVVVGHGMVGPGTRVVMEMASVAMRQPPHGTLAAGAPPRGAATLVSSGAKVGIVEVIPTSANKPGSGTKVGRTVRMMPAKAMIGNGKVALIQAREHLGERRNPRFAVPLENSADRGGVPDNGEEGGTENAKIQKMTGLPGTKVSFCVRAAARTNVTTALLAMGAVVGRTARRLVLTAILF